MGGNLIAGGRGVSVESGLWGQSSSRSLPDGSQWLRAGTDGGEKLGDHCTIFLFVRSGWEARQGKPGLSWLSLTSAVRCVFVFMQFFSAPPFPSHFCFIQMYFVNVLILGCPLSFGKAFCLGSVHWVHLTPPRVHQKFVEQNEACTRIKFSSVPLSPSCRVNFLWLHEKSRAWEAGTPQTTRSSTRDSSPANQTPPLHTHFPECLQPLP